MYIYLVLITLVTKDLLELIFMVNIKRRQITFWSMPEDRAQIILSSDKRRRRKKINRWNFTVKFDECVKKSGCDLDNTIILCWFKVQFHRSKVIAKATLLRNRFCTHLSNVIITIAFTLWKRTLMEHWYPLERCHLRYRSVETEH